MPSVGTFLRSAPALGRRAPKRGKSQPAAPAASPALVRLRERLVLRAQRIRAEMRRQKKTKAKLITGAFSPRPRLASWRRLVLPPKQRKARTLKRRQAMVKASRAANRG